MSGLPLLHIIHSKTTHPDIISCEHRCAICHGIQAHYYKSGERKPCIIDYCICIKCGSHAWLDDLHKLSLMLTGEMMPPHVDPFPCDICTAARYLREEYRNA